MRVASLSVSHFRSFGSTGEKVIFPSIKKPLSIIGHNNCGKTNLLEALLITTGQKEDYYRQKKQDFHNCDTSQKIKLTARFNECFTILSPYPGEKADKSCWGSQFNCGFIGERADGHLICIDDNEKPIIKSEKIKAQGLPASFMNYKKNLQVVYINFHDLDKHLSLSSDGLLGKLFREIKEDFYKPSNNIKLKDDSERPRVEIFEQLVANLKKVLYTDMLKGFVEQLSEEVAASLELKKGLVGFDFTFASARDLYNKVSLLVTDAENKVALPITSLGSGLKAMIIVAMLKVLADRHDGEKIFILEEPETFLHELYQEYLYSVLCTLAESNQVIYTTHSKKFVDIFEPRSIIKVHNPEFKQSQIIQVHENNGVPQEVLDELALDSVEDFAFFMRSLDPNLGLVLFARKALIVEGPHDVLTYRLIFKAANLAAKNIAIVPVWGKDTSLYVARLASSFMIEPFLVHDWDIENGSLDVNIDPSTDSTAPYHSLDSDEKAQYTKDRKILLEFGDKVHWNKKNLESVLQIQKKGTKEIAEKLAGKKLDQIREDFPGIVDDSMINFMEITAAS